MLRSFTLCLQVGREAGTQWSLIPSVRGYETSVKGMNQQRVRSVTWTIWASPVLWGFMVSFFCWKTGFAE